MTSKSYIDGYDIMQHWWYILLDDMRALRIVALVERCGGLWRGTREELARECGGSGNRTFDRSITAAVDAGFITVTHRNHYSEYRLSDAYTSGELKQRAVAISEGGVDDAEPIAKNGKRDDSRLPFLTDGLPKMANDTLYNNNNKRGDARACTCEETSAESGDTTTPEPDTTPDPDTTGKYLEKWVMYYRGLTGAPYAYNGSTTTAIRDLVGMLRQVERQNRAAKGQPPPTEEDILFLFGTFICKSYEYSDKWQRSHFDLKMLVNQFNPLISKILNNEQYAIFTGSDSGTSAADDASELAALEELERSLRQ